MTDKKLAEEFANNGYALGCTKLPFDVAKEAFLAGLEAGREMAEADLATVAYMQGAERYKPKWHDLRKNPNDLPEKEDKFNSKLVYISYPDRDTDFAYYEFPHKEWYRLFNDELTISPIAWCEIPKFEETE